VDHGLREGPPAETVKPIVDQEALSGERSSRAGRKAGKKRTRFEALKKKDFGDMRARRKARLPIIRFRRRRGSLVSERGGVKKKREKKRFGAVYEVSQCKIRRPSEGGREIECAAICTHVLQQF